MLVYRIPSDAAGDGDYRPTVRKIRLPSPEVVDAVAGFLVPLTASLLFSAVSDALPAGVL